MSSKNAIYASQGYRKDIQGMRAIAVLMVVVFHTGFSQLSGGYIGVDVFFVISGFLITSHLAGSLDRENFSLVDFYARRIRRLLPASFVVLVASVLAALIYMPAFTIPRIFKDAFATALYMPNVLFAWRGTDYLAEGEPSVFQHYWSLGVEEQFYLFWPLLLFALYWPLKGRHPMLLLAAVLVITLLSLALCVWATSWRQPWAFFLLPSRAWELGAGAVIALFLRNAGNFTLLKSRVMVIVGWASLLVLIFVAFKFDKETIFPSYNAAIPVLCAVGLILSGVNSHSHGVAYLLGIAPLQFIGKISYSMYLVHWPLIMIPHQAVELSSGSELSLWTTACLGVLSVPLSWVLWKYVEEPVRKSEFKITASTRSSFASAVMASFVIAIISLAAARLWESIPLHSGRPAAIVALSPNPQGGIHVPSNAAPPLRSVSRDNPVIYENGCHREFDSTDSSGCRYGDATAAVSTHIPVVALFGDSHAANWFPALQNLAENGLIMLDSNTKSGCTVVDGHIFLREVRYLACEHWRDGVMQRFLQIPPDIVIVGYFIREDRYPGWVDMFSSLLRKLRSHSRVIVMADVPAFPYDPAICLSANLDNAMRCAMPAAQVLNAAYASVDKAAALAAGAEYLDLNSYICNELCFSVIGNVLVYRDSHHLTATFSRQMADILGDAIFHKLDYTSPE